MLDSAYMINKKSPKIKLSDDFYKDSSIRTIIKKIENFKDPHMNQIENGALLFKYLTVGRPNENHIDKYIYNPTARTNIPNL